MSNEGGDCQQDFKNRLLEFTASIIRLAETLPRTPAGAHFGRLLLHSGTTMMTRQGEALIGESPRIVLFKLKSALDHIEDIRRWLELIKQVPLVDGVDRLEPLMQENNELIRIFGAKIEDIRRQQAIASSEEE